MNRRIVSCALVASLSFTIGCYSTGMVTKEELKANANQADIAVSTKESMEYRFSRENYSIQGDTLSGIGVEVYGGSRNKKPFHGRIALADINSIKAEEFNVTRTVIAIGIPVALIGGFAIAFFTADRK